MLVEVLGQNMIVSHNASVRTKLTHLPNNVAPAHPSSRPSSRPPSHYGSAPLSLLPQLDQVSLQRTSANACVGPHLHKLGDEAHGHTRFEVLHSVPVHVWDVKAFPCADFDDRGILRWPCQHVHVRPARSIIPQTAVPIAISVTLRRWCHQDKSFAPRDDVHVLQ